MNYNISEQIQDLNVDVYQQFGILGENKKYLPWTLQRKISNRISKRYEDAVHELEQMERAEIRNMRRAEIREFFDGVKAKLRAIAKRFISLFKKKSKDSEEQTTPDAPQIAAETAEVIVADKEPTTAAEPQTKADKADTAQ